MSLFLRLASLHQSVSGASVYQTLDVSSFDDNLLGVSREAVRETASSFESQNAVSCVLDVSWHGI